MKLQVNNVMLMPNYATVNGQLESGGDVPPSSMSFNVSSEEAAKFKPGTAVEVTIAAPAEAAPEKKK